MEETIGQRINVVRKKLNLTLEKFGEKIGISKVSVRAIEKGINNPSEQTIKLICSVYNVDYAWLTQGVGEDIFISIPESKIDQIMEDYGLTEKERPLVRGYLEAPEEVRQQVADYLNSIVEREIARREKEKNNK
ncbi:helix-turn-helix domain-containing protein [Holdemanella biformis]|uniref:helix-turn-helix domain-containing protein n=1 Tax=Holdemanella biformis TaxID=1735 RepID=UPI0026758FD9|nr:helix-turn-helix domain-containing protein [Holdemanella biformis]